MLNQSYFSCDQQIQPKHFLGEYEATYYYQHQIEGTHVEFELRTNLLSGNLEKSRKENFDMIK